MPETAAAVHTPGPWHFQAGQLWSKSHDGLGLGIQSRLLLGTWTQGPGLGGAAAPNARLIEAAPELYDLLVEARRELSSNGQYHSRLIDQIDGVLGKIEAA